MPNLSCHWLCVYDKTACTKFQSGQVTLERCIKPNIWFIKLKTKNVSQIYDADMRVDMLELLQASVVFWVSHWVEYVKIFKNQSLTYRYCSFFSFIYQRWTNLKINIIIIYKHCISQWRWFGLRKIIFQSRNGLMGNYSDEKDMVFKMYIQR